MFFIETWNTPHCSTGQSPASLMMKRKIKTKLPTIIAPSTSTRHQRANERDTLSKAKHKTYTDCHRQAKHRQIQDKATIKAPLDPDYYIVTEVRVTKITGERRGETKTRNVEKWKLYKERPAYLNITEPPKVGEEMEPESNSDFECKLRSEHGPQDRREQHRATSGGEEAHPPMDPAVPVQAAAKSRQVIRESWVVAAGPW